MAGGAAGPQPANARISAHPVYTRCSPMSEPGFQERLDSWKAIADYLGRDVATVRRWEKSLGLPVRRVPGGPGRSVFAFRHEIDAWLKSSQARDEAPGPGLENPVEPPAVVEPEQPSADPPMPVVRRWPVRSVAAAIVALAAIVYLWPFSRGRQSLDLELETDHIVARDARGGERWRYEFGPERSMAFDLPGAVTALPNNGGYLVAATNSINVGNGAIGNGELLWLSPAGELRRRATFTDRLSFGPRTYGGPWVLSDYRVGGDFTADHIAVAVRHYQWWPSVVTLLGSNWEPVQKFVNAGWVEHLAWTAPNRLIISGFYNPLDGGMVALLDAGAMAGTSPLHTEEPTFVCTACGSDKPLRYIVLPRSELNRAVTAPFNRATLQLSGDRIVVRTVEEPRDNGYAAEALYEFTMDLELVGATYGDRYWDRHRALEASGQLDHPRERCPERRGPPFIRSWTPTGGWKKVVPQDY